MTRTFESFEALYEFLRHWHSWVGAEQYDFNGLVILFCACLDALGDQGDLVGHEHLLGELRESFMTGEHVELMRSLAEGIQATRPAE